MSIGRVQTIKGFAARLRPALEIITSFAVIVAAAVFVLQTLLPRIVREPPPGIPIPTQPISLVGAATIGDRKAAAVMMEFSDFECAFCQKFVSDVLPTLRERFIRPGRLLLVFRNLPIPGHQYAEGAAIAAACAAEQAKFEAFHDLLFANPKSLDPDSLKRHATAIGMSSGAYAECLSGAGASTVKAEAELARSLGVKGTPAFFVGTLAQDGRLQVKKTIKGKQSVAEYIAAVAEVTSAK